MNKNKLDIRSFFNSNYSRFESYWWKGNNRYSIVESEHTSYNAAIIRAIKESGYRNALDIGAGEGADSIRLAKLNLLVDCIEISEIGCSKIAKNAADNNISLNIINTNIENYICENTYDVIICNGVLHYIADSMKTIVIKKMQGMTSPGGINAISLFSKATPIPECHKIVDVFPDEEGGICESSYYNWNLLYKLFENAKIETSHNDMPIHMHSYIKFIARNVL